MTQTNPAAGANGPRDVTPQPRTFTEFAPSRVLMTADAVGGVWTYALQLVAEYGKSDIEVVLVVMGGKPSPDQAAEAGALKNLTMIGTDLRLEWMDDPQADLELAGQLLLEIETERRPDIVHLNGFAHAVLPFRAPVLVAAHSDVSSWWTACRDVPLPTGWAAYEARVAAGVRAAGMLVAPSAAYLDAFTMLHGRPRQARVIHNGRDPAAFAAAPKRDMALAAGRLWDDAKNIATLSRAAEGLAWPVLIAGDAASSDGRSFRTPANVVALGRLGRDDLRSRMAEAAVFAAPARYEPFGLAILEAALSSCALVLGDIATLRELWGEAATYVRPDDADALRDIIEALLFDPERSAALGRRARRHALRYTSRAMSEGYLEAYRNLLARSVAAQAAPRAERACAGARA